MGLSYDLKLCHQKLVCSGIWTFVKSNHDQYPLNFDHKHVPVRSGRSVRSVDSVPKYVLRNINVYDLKTFKTKDDHHINGSMTDILSALIICDENGKNINISMDIVKIIVVYCDYNKYEIIKMNVEYLMYNKCDQLSKFHVSNGLFDAKDHALPQQCLYWYFNEKMKWKKEIFKEKSVSFDRLVRQIN